MLQSLTVAVWDVVGSFEKNPVCDTEGAGIALSLEEDAAATFEEPTTFLAPQVFSYIYNHKNSNKLTR